MKTRIGFPLLLTLLCLSADAVVAAQQITDFRFCPGQFALCAASICTPTGNTIKVNGSNQQFDEADCLCPVFTGLSVADVKGGNMQGSCAAPTQGGIWSLYSIQSDIPQEINGWATSPQSLTDAPYMECPKDLHLGTQQVNCFSFACDSQTTINGVPVVTCHCAMGESPEGKNVPPPTAFVTQAGQKNLAVCSEHPTAGTIKTQ